MLPASPRPRTATAGPAVPTGLSGTGGSGPPAAVVFSAGCHRVGGGADDGPDTDLFMRFHGGLPGPSVGFAPDNPHLGTDLHVGVYRGQREAAAFVGRHAGEERQAQPRPVGVDDGV